MSEPTRRPHILVLLASQLRQDVLGPFGGKQCPTPMLDRLAAHSSVFLRHFTSCPLGSPSRATLLTGLDPHAHGVLINGSAAEGARHATLGPQTPTVIERLCEAGYRVVHTGVQSVHADPPLAERAPDVEMLGPSSLSQHLKSLEARGLMYGDLKALRDPVLDTIAGKPTILGGMSSRSAVFPLREDLYYDSAITQHAVEALDGHSGRPDDKPLALWCHFWLPHPPLWAPQRYAEMFDPQQVQMPGTTGRWYPSTPAMQLANFCGQMGAHVAKEQWRGAWAMYLGMTAMLDVLVGRVLAAADRAGVLSDALVVFASDHGEMLGGRGLFQKMCMYEPAVRVPLLVKPPGKLDGLPRRQHWRLTSHRDVTATVVEAAGLEPLAGAAGTALQEVMRGDEPDDAAQQHVFASYDGNAGLACAQRMARSRTHKLIHNIGDEPEFYDLVEDPRETRNLVGADEHKPARDALRRRLAAWMARTGDTEAPL